MKKLLALKRRLRTINSINQTIQALQVISIARTKSIQDAFQKAKRFQAETERLLKITGCPKLGADPKNQHPFTQIVIIGTNRGFCGSFNNNLFPVLEKSLKEEKDKAVKIISLGKRVAPYLARTKKAFSQGDDALIEKTFFSSAQHFIAPLYLALCSGAADRLVIIYNTYYSMLCQKPIAMTVWPLNLSSKTAQKPVLLEPSAQELKEEVCRLYIESVFYRCLIESVVGELGSRLVTLKNAADNCQDLAKQITLAMNKSRQADITAELTEITTTFEALKEGE